MSLIATTWGRFQGTQRRVIGVACGAHILHDGYTDLLYVLLPLWQTEFGLDYAEIGLLRALYVGAMAGFQVPSAFVAERLGGPMLLGLGTALAGIGYLGAGASRGFWMLVAALVVGGIGSSVQHPIAANMVAHAFPGRRSRSALASYNFSGDLGKMALPAATAGLLTFLPWRGATTVIGIVGLAAAAAILAVRGLPARGAAAADTDADAGRAAADGPPPSRRGFPLLLSIAMIDSATRMGFLTFLPFLLKAKGADLPMIGVALTLIFAGGAAGKLICGWLGSRIGMVSATWVSEGATALGILALLPLPLGAGLAILPLIGVALNGTSSVLYGTVPELVAPERRQRAFGVFYTGAVGAGALAPVVYGVASDWFSIPAMMVLVAAVVLLTLPLSWLLRPVLNEIAPA
jgi:MFS transporter, FSR family, fosmidomycin resistance protein